MQVDKLELLVMLQAKIKDVLVVVEVELEL